MDKFFSNLFFDSLSSEDVRSQSRISGSSINLVIRAVRLSRLMEKRAQEIGLIGVGIISHREARLATFRRRVAARRVARILVEDGLGPSASVTEYLQHVEAATRLLTDSDCELMITKPSEWMWAVLVGEGEEMKSLVSLDLHERLNFIFEEGSA